jgi:hypothetical protein
MKNLTKDSMEMEFTLDSTFSAVTESEQLKFRFVFWGYSSPWFTGVLEANAGRGQQDSGWVGRALQECLVQYAA